MKKENKNVTLIHLPQLREFLKNGLWDLLYLSEWIILCMKNSWSKIKAEVFRKLNFKLSPRRRKSLDLSLAAVICLKELQESPVLFIYKFFIDNWGYPCSDFF